MEAAKETVENNGAEILWDDETKQDYATWTAGDVTYKIWLENEKSLEPKLALMKENKLAGTAANIQPAKIIATTKIEIIFFIVFPPLKHFMGSASF